MVQFMRDGWQSFISEIRYKKAEEMIVPDALLRAHTQHDPSFSSPGEKDPYFPYVPENTGNITLLGEAHLNNFFPLIKQFKEFSS